MTECSYHLIAPIPANSPLDMDVFIQTLNSSGYKAERAERDGTDGFRSVNDSGWGVVAWMEDGDEAREHNQELSERDLPDGVTPEQISACPARLSVWSDDDPDSTNAELFEGFVQFLMERFGLLLFDERLGEWRCLENRPGYARVLMDLEKGVGLTLDEDEIPQELRFLIPYVEKWSFDLLDHQDAFVAQMQQHRAEEIAPFNRAVDNADPLIAAWAKTISFDKHASEFTPEDWKHPYWAFLNVLKLREMTGYDDDDHEVVAAQERHAQERHVERYREAAVEADQAFRQRDYASYLSILEPYDDLLTQTQQKKKSLAARRAGECGSS